MGRINLRELKPFQSRIELNSNSMIKDGFLLETCWLGLELPLILNPRKARKSCISEKPIRIN